MISWSCCHKFFGEGVPFIVSSWKKRKLKNINSVIIIRGFYGFLFHCWVPNNFSLGCPFIYGVGVGRVCTERRVSYIARVSAVLSNPVYRSSKVLDIGKVYALCLFSVSGFYAQCPSKKVCFNAHIWTKSKFYGMSIGVVNHGGGKRVDNLILQDFQCRR